MNIDKTPSVKATALNTKSILEKFYSNTEDFYRNSLWQHPFFSQGCPQGPLPPPPWTGPFFWNNWWQHQSTVGWMGQIHHIQPPVSLVRQLLCICPVNASLWQDIWVHVRLFPEIVIQQEVLLNGYCLKHLKDEQEFTRKLNNIYFTTLSSFT